MVDVVLNELIELDDRIETLEHELIPSRADELAMSVALHYLDLTASEQSEIRALISPKLGRYLIMFSGRLAVLAVRRQDEHALRAALALHAMENFQFDPRENLRVFALIGDACGRLGASLGVLWEQVGPAFSSEQRSYAESVRSPRAVESMGMEGAYVDGEFDYLPTGSPSRS